MAFSFTKIKSPHTIRWMWPLKVGLPKKIANLKPVLLSKHWPQSFVTIEEAGKNKHYNIYLFDGDLPYQQYLPLDLVTADIIFVLLGKELKANNFGNYSDNILQHFNASGIFIFDAGSDFSNWFSYFTEELSHNVNLVEALKRTAKNGSFSYDPKVETQTTLSYVISKMCFTLQKSWFSNRTFNVISRLTDKSSLTGIEIVKLIQSKLSYFDSETQSASDLKDISTQVFIDVPVIFDKADMSVQMTEPPPKAKPEIVRVGSSGRKYNGGGPTKKAIAFAKKSFRNFAGPRRNGSGGGAAKRPAPKKRTDFKHGIKPGKKRETHLIKLVKTKPAEVNELPRYLQANIKTLKNKKVQDCLKPNVEYKLGVRIGYADKDFVDSGEEIDTTTIFKKSRQTNETIQVKFKSNLNEKIQFTKISLPRQGNSTLADFHFKTNTTSGIFEGEIFAYHKNRLIQHVQLTAAIDKKVVVKPGKSTIKMKVIFCARKNLADIKDRTEFAASVEYEPGKKKSSTLHGITKNKPVDLYFDDGLKGHLSDMKKAIEDALIDIKNHPAKLTAKGNEELLLLLAFKGNLIYTNHLRGAIAPEGPLQIISNYQSYVPLDFVYSLPAPDLNATLCDKAAAALLDGACKKCFDRSQDPAPHICPFGFWAFSRIVERHSYQKRKNNQQSDYSIVSEPGSSRDPLRVLQNALYGSSQRVETDATKGLRQQIAAGIKKNAKHLFEANDWKNWTALAAQHTPDSLILVVHIEKDKKFNIDKIEIGNNDFVIQNHFGSQVISGKNLKPPPFIVIIGCEATNFDAGGFDVSAQLMNEGAAIVVSNFTKIRGRQAKDVVIKLLDFLKQNSKTEILFGEVLLKLRQYLLSQGLMAGLSLVAHGDADWKIKT